MTRTETLRHAASLTLSLTLAVSVAAITVGTVRLLRTTDNAMQEARATVTVIRDYAEMQSAMLRTQKAQKSIEASIEVAAAAKASIILLNRQVIPRTMRALSSLDTAIVSLDALIIKLNRELGDGILPELKITTRKAGLATDASAMALRSLDESIRESSAKISLTLDDMHRVLSDPAWLETLKNIEATSGHAESVAASAEESARRMPQISDSLEKIANTSQRWQKALIAVQLLAIIARAF